MDIIATESTKDTEKSLLTHLSFHVFPWILWPFDKKLRVPGFHGSVFVDTCLKDYWSG
ncbi:MAG: hypothetical protein WBP44_06030 [Gammaproteobacteria bacterium]